MLTNQLFVRSMALKNAYAISRLYHGGKYPKPAVMDDLPVPQGDWYENHHKKQKKYNSILAIGIAVFVSSIAIAKGTGAIHLNASPPRSLD